MARLLDRLRRKTSETPPTTVQVTPSPSPAPSSPGEDSHRRSDSDYGHSDAYFHTFGEMEQAISARNYDQAARLALEAIEHVPGFVNESVLVHSEFSIESIPPLEVGGLMLALADNAPGIERIREVTASRAELARWHDIHLKHEESRALFRAIERVVAAKPGVLQNGMKQEVGAEDRRRISTLIDWLEKAGRIRREPNGKTYALFPTSGPGARPAPPEPAAHVVTSHRRGKAPARKMVDWSRVTLIPLPHSPSKWEIEPRDRREDTLSAEFELVDANEWTVLGIDKLAPAERPDPAFRRLYATGSGVLALDDLGKSDPNAPAAALRYGRSGDIKAKAPLAHGFYRIGVSPMSGSFIGLSRAHIAHAYDEQLRLILETDLSKSPEIAAIRKRLGITPEELHTHIRTVALSDDGQRYLFTVVDEAWCIDVNGESLWGIGMPLKDGYQLEDTRPYGTRDDIQQALDTMGLALPLEGDEVKKRYRALAKEWHPDVNKSPDAGVRMQAINHAVSLLTGLSGDELARFSGVRMAYSSRDSFVIKGQGIEITVSMGISTSEVSAADWIYASAFVANSGCGYLATYSGKVLEVDEGGMPICYYSIGSVPRRIIDTGERFYLLTDTRLYVLQAGALVALVDVSEGGDLIVTQTGFGLLEKKRFRFFDEEGALIATVLSKSPLRRVYRNADTMIVETRTHRLRIAGTRPWWVSIGAT